MILKISHITHSRLNIVNLEIESLVNKVECVFPMVVVSVLPHAEFGPYDHREDAPHSNKCYHFDFLGSVWLNGQHLYFSMKYFSLNFDLVLPRWITQHVLKVLTLLRLH